MARGIVMLLVLTVAATVTQGALQHLIADNPEYPGMCADKKAGIFPMGATWFLEGCVRAHCRRSEGRMVITYASCSPFGLPPNCELVTDESLVYPGCCPSPKCS